jgi:hypothetical protein
MSQKSKWSFWGCGLSWDGGLVSSAVIFTCGGFESSLKIFEPLIQSVVPDIFGPGLRFILWDWLGQTLINLRPQAKRSPAAPHTYPYMDSPSRGIELLA